MGCASSKRVEASADIYRPAPASFAVFDINSIQEPWLMVSDTKPQDHNEKPTFVPTQILEKLNNLDSAEQAPHSWDEVSKALEDLKPSLAQANSVFSAPTTTTPAKPGSVQPSELKKQSHGNSKVVNKSLSFHTIEEFDAKLNPKPPASELRKTESMKTEQVKKTEKTEQRVPEAPNGIIKPVKENIFIVRDRLEREKEGKQANFDKLISMRVNPLSQYPEKCPPGGNDSVVLYTTSLGGVRKTYEDCNRVRAMLEGHRVVFDERDVALHGGFLSELKELIGEEEGVSVPRLFVKGRYLGGAEQVVELNETGRLGKMLSYAKVERGIGRLGCEGCGGARFVPCLECGGSCKVVVDGDKKQRCSVCNENGLVHCPACL
ncbi:hypothetical protein FEM48_Zijuj11G0010800 [Ziziphus jujuba var. spinosa]|uniref:Glutaredoxin domain-containing protein n=1 Tax=Ziziphus jujuba var. spinosa TaxID=714518 RepID=A0A978UFY6_ZIZJJ|nr:hypothetical protein FEM48_Zijuj11G0010800 [Ziziphus jujuba var. spinosa]